MSMRKPLRSCVNHPGVPPSPPSLVLCRECLDNITTKIEAMIADLDARATTSRSGGSEEGNNGNAGEL